MPVIGLVAFGIGLVVFAGSLWHRQRLPDEGMSCVERSETVEDLEVGLDWFNRRVKITGWTYLLSAVLMFSGAVLVLVG